MTAIVGVLNKHAVAIAADSAVTMGDTHKVINSANKIFTLSKFHPVAVMTYNCASFMGVPWDIIIKEYRKQLRDKCFPLLKDYVDDFVSFLRVRDFFCDNQTKLECLHRMLVSFYEDSRKTLGNNPTIKQLEELWSKFLVHKKTSKKCPDFESYPIDSFRNSFSHEINEFANKAGVANAGLLTEAFFCYLSITVKTSLYTGLVFTGYGENEIFPSIVPLIVSPLVVEGRLKYYIDEENSAQISEHGTTAAISPFAQVDVIQTILRGINPAFQDIIAGVTKNSMKSIIDAVVKIINANPANYPLAARLKDLDVDSEINNLTKKISSEMNKCYTNKILNTVVSLDKEDMANMAGSFVSLTSLVRRMQPGEETVGGPVDVAVISKGDGFIWIKRKHYFSPELNTAFFSNYFK